MSYIKNSLSQGEKIEHLFNLHWVSWITVWACAVGGIVMLFVGLSASINPLQIMSGSLLALGGIFSASAVYLFWDLKCQEFGVTNKRVIHKRGIFSLRTNEMKLTSIETVEIDQGIIDRAFGFGTIKVTGRGISDVVFASIDDPLLVKNKIESISNPVD